MYTIEVWYNKAWHFQDTAECYRDAVSKVEALREAMGEDALISINPHEPDELERINWRNDGITRRYVEEHRIELLCILSMTPSQLATTVTYCVNCDNPYAEELSRRAGMELQYDRASDPVERAELTTKAAAHFGITLL